MAQTATREKRAYANNRRAYHEYHVLETLEVGIELVGTEVKSIRAGKINLREAYARVERGELWLYNCHISHYDAGNRYNHEPTRKRRLLAHTREIGRLAGRASESGMTLIPLRVYDRKGHIKVELGLCKGKHSYDKRAALAERDARREIERATKRDLF
jgi:SsrA-binding protein